MFVVIISSCPDIQDVGLHSHTCVQLIVIKGKIRPASESSRRKIEDEKDASFSCFILLGMPRFQPSKELGPGDTLRILMNQAVSVLATIFNLGDQL